LRLRYKTNDKGHIVKTAEIYTANEHDIDPQLIDQDAVRIAHRLSRSGFKAYIVGGAVRDLLSGKRPKDFDLVTDAEPNQIRKIFRNSRIIGKRFRLVHIFFHDDKIIEVSTFRSIEAGTFNNVFGTIEEDALRRDFSVNALYYDPVEKSIIDFVGGYKDLKARKLKPVIPLKKIFTEDPVRMIRAVKYSISTGCRIGFFLRRAIRSSASLLAAVSPSRISEEAFKILQGGYAAPILEELSRYGLLASILPHVGEVLASRSDAVFRKRVIAGLCRLDDAVRDHHESRRSIQLSYLVAEFLYNKSPWGLERKPSFPEAYQWIKEFLKPVTPPNVEVERCLVYLIRKRKLYMKQGELPAIEAQLPGAEPASSGQDAFPEGFEPREPSQDDGAAKKRRRRPRRRPHAGGPPVTHHA